MTLPWLKKVLRDLEAAILVLVDAQLGRAPVGGATLEEQRRRACERAQATITKAATAYERQAASLSKGERKRAAALFGAAFALRRRVMTSGAGADLELCDLVQRAEGVLN